MSKKRIGLVASLCASLVLLLGLKPATTQTPDSNAFQAEAQEFANKILQSAAAQFLSGSALNALNLLSGRVTIPQRIQRGFVAKALPFQLSPSEVMVNDPSLDGLSDLDITTQSETAVAAFGDNVVVAYNNSRNAFSFSSGGSAMGYSRSSDSGASFTDLGLTPAPSGPPPGLNLGDPGLVADREANFYASAIVLDFMRPPGFMYPVGISKSTDGGFTFGAPVSPPPSGPPDTFHFSDKEFIAVDSTGGRFDASVYVSWTDFMFSPPPIGSRVAIAFSRSTDGGASFTAPINISPVVAGTVVQGSEPAVGPNGEVYVAWFRFSPAPNGVFVAKSANGGASFGPPILVAPLKPIGFLGGQTSLLGNFRVNSFPRIDVDPTNGNVYIIFAANPSRFDGDSADVFFTRSTNGGATWSVPIRVNDDEGKTDQFFPDIAVNADGVIEAIWYDRRLSPRNLMIDVFRAQSTDGGLSFGPNERVTSQSFLPFLPAVGYDPTISPLYMGDYIDIKSDTTADGRGFRFLLAWGDCRRIITTLQGTRPDQDVFFTTH